jgi:ATP synthase F1 gamma subunit
MQPAIFIKRTIDFNKSFRSILEVMKLVAVAEYHNLERRLKSFAELQGMLAEFLKAVDLSGVRHPFLDPGDRPPGVVAVTSDAGLLGGINAQVMWRAVDLVREHGGKLVVIGEKGFAYAQDAGVPFVHYPGIVDTQRYAQACQIRDDLIREIVAGSMSGLRVVYPHAHSFVVHRVEIVTLLPFERPQAPGAPREETIFESDPAAVLEYLVYLVIAQRLFEIFGLARVCEQAARFVHLEESCNKILDMNKKLTLQYFRRRHEIIDSNMRELFAARKTHG